jgi:hypothetical protein
MQPAPAAGGQGEETTRRHDGVAAGEDVRCVGSHRDQAARRALQFGGNRG